MLDFIFKAADLLMAIRKKHGEDAKRYAGYVEAIADDAELLASVWTDLLKEQAEETNTNLQELYQQDRFFDSNIGNMPPLSRLEGFYRRLNVFFGESDPGKAKLLCEHIADLIKERKEAKSTLKRFLETGNDFELRKLNKNVGLLHQHAGELRVLAHELRAKA